GDYCMAYGSLSNYLLAEFSPMEVKRSDDYKFREGMAAFRGNCFFGGNVVRRNGFLRIKKSA
ncbi:MAG: phage major capsid protein, partial [Selenomonadaceae bacterium]|nr:phage major capsid protein [Selenomonadaceae bacterium]